VAGAGARAASAILALFAAAFGRLAGTFAPIANNAAQRAGWPRKNPAEAGFKSKGGNAHD
jgi:hypothetical protein